MDDLLHNTYYDEIALHLCDPSPFNPRVITDSESISEMVESIKRLGVIEPILVRIREEGRYEIIAGERRVYSSKKAGLTTVPARIFRELTDDLAWQLCQVENLMREDLDLIEEVLGVIQLVDKGWTYDQIADRLGKPASWVARRAAINELIQPWRDEIANAEGMFGHWTAGHYELIARMPADVQKSLFNDLSANQVLIPATIAALKKRLESAMLELSTAPWDLTDKKLVRQAGACNACSKRTGCHPVLFDDLHNDEHDRCLDRACFDGKKRAHIERLFDKHGQGVIYLNPGYNRDLRADIKEAAREKWHVEMVDPYTEGAKPVLHISGEYAGHFKGFAIIPKGKSDRATVPRPSLTTVEKMYRHRKKTGAYIVKQVRALIDDEIHAPSPPGLSTLLPLLYAFGTYHTRKQAGERSYQTAYKEKGEPRAVDAWGEYDRTCKLGEVLVGSMETELWRSVLSTLQERLTTVVWDSVVERSDWPPIADAERIATLLGADVEELWQEALKAHPYPRSWAVTAQDRRNLEKLLAKKKKK